MSHLCSIPFLCSQTNFFQTSIEEKKVSLEWKELSTASLLAQIVLSPQKFSVSCLHERILLAAVLNLISKNYFKVITSRMRNCNTLTCSTSICLTFFLVLPWNLTGSQIFSNTISSDVEANGHWNTSHQLAARFLYSRDSGIHGGVCCSARLNHPVTVHNEHSKYKEQNDI